MVYSSLKQIESNACMNVYPLYSGSHRFYHVFYSHIHLNQRFQPYIALGVDVVVTLLRAIASSTAHGLGDGRITPTPGVLKASSSLHELVI